MWTYDLRNEKLNENEWFANQRKLIVCYVYRDIEYPMILGYSNLDYCLMLILVPPPWDIQIKMATIFSNVAFIEEICTSLYYIYRVDQKFFPPIFFFFF